METPTEIRRENKQLQQENKKLLQQQIVNDDMAFDKIKDQLEEINEELEYCDYLIEERNKDILQLKLRVQIIEDQKKRHEKNKKQFEDRIKCIEENKKRFIEKYE